MLQTYLGVLLALVAVLALVGIAGRWARRVSAGGLLGREGTALPLTVLRRVPLGPRQGVALLRVGERILLVTVGDGGVHRLLQLEEDEAAHVLAETQAAGPASFASVLASAQKALGRRGAPALLLAAALAFAPTASSAQRAPAPGRPAQAAPQAPATQATATAATAPQPTAATPVETGAAVVEKLAPQMDLRLGGGDGARTGGLRLNGSVGVVVTLGLLSLLPTLVLMTTGFTRILVVLYFLRQALGTQNAPPGPLVAGMALILTGFVMAPTMTTVNREAITPWLDGKIEQTEMMTRAAEPMRAFMLRQTRPADVRRMVALSRQAPPATAADVPFVTLMAAFTISELRTAFTIGFALFLPFIVIDVVVASVLMSLGMFMLPPQLVALPFKLLLFVLVDGWGLVAQSLVAGFN